jgi:hypothetical protein
MQPLNVTKAELREIDLGDGTSQPTEQSTKVPVQFNPESLKVTFTNQIQGGDQRGGSSQQFVGRGTTKLALDLWFDVTALDASGQGGGGQGGGQGNSSETDVRKLTEKVAYFMKPKGRDRRNRNRWIPPAVRFIWGTFKFDGIMESLNETLDYFSEEGKPLRAMVSISITSQEIQFQFNDQATGSGGAPNSAATPGTQPTAQARQGDTVQRVAGRNGQQGNWQQVAQDNNIENPRLVTPGDRLVVRPRSPRR